MRIIQDSLRKKQSLLASAAVTCLLVCTAIVFFYQRSVSQVNEGINALQSQMVSMFNDNELMAEATGVRYQQISHHQLCGDVPNFTPRGNAWAINAAPGAIDKAHGALITKQPDDSARCIYQAAEYIRAKVRTLNPEQHDVHRYLIAKDGRWFYWFTPTDSAPFQFETSQMAQNPHHFFSKPEMYYDRVLQKSLRKKSLSATQFYADKITGDLGYTIVSYIYDLSASEPSNDIIAYLAYDLSRVEIRRMLLSAFANKIPEGLILGFQSRQTGEIMCIVGNCSWLDDYRIHQISLRYEIKYALPVLFFVTQDPRALMMLILAPVLLVLLFLFFRYHLNRADLRFYRDPLTGCFTRNIFTLVQQRSLPFSTVILFDCNKFKAINDNYGHTAGDKALQAISYCMLTDIRANADWVIRSGGDEFIILLNRTDIAHTHMIAERIAARIAVFPFSPQGKSIPLSVSWGVARCVDSLDDAIQQADAQMYEMKKKNGESR